MKITKKEGKRPFYADFQGNEYGEDDQKDIECNDSRLK